MSTDNEKFICCICGDTESSKYYRHKNKNGVWDRKSRLCISCYALIRRYGTTDKDEIEEYKNKYVKEKIDANRKKIRCCICGSRETYTRIDGTPCWRTHRCQKGDCTRHICERCFSIYDPNSQSNIIKSMRMCRIDKFDIENIFGNDKVMDRIKGLIGEAVIAKTRGLKIISIELDNFSHMLDFSRDQKYGIIQSKLRRGKQGCYNITFGMEHFFDTLFVLGLSNKMESIDRVYAIPEGELYGIQSTDIVEKNSKWEKFRIDEKTYNDCYLNIMRYLKDVKYFGVEDIKKWLDI